MQKKRRGSAGTGDAFMGYTAQFKWDLFISYRRASNEAQDRWVDAFRDELGAKLKDFVGEVMIWRDETQLRAGEPWRRQIAEGIDNAAIFLAIISRTYLDSDECRKELDQFLARMKDPSGGPQRRIMPILKQPLRSEEDLPHELGEIHRHQFFLPEKPGSIHFRELGPTLDDKHFWETLGRVAQDLMLALEQIKGYAQRRALGKVFVACVGPELQLERERLRADLQQRGYLTVPEHEYLWNADDLRDKIDRNLDAALLCIHLVSRTESIEPKTAERARLQLQLAHEAMKRKGRPEPLVWMQPASAVDPSVRPLIDYIERDLANEGVEYWQGGLEDLKTQIYDKLPPAESTKASAQAREIVLLVEEGDIANVGALKALLVERLAIEPHTIKFAGAVPRDAVRLTHGLTGCGQCLVFWAAQPEEWIQDLLKNDALAGHLGRDKMCIYSAAPSTPEKSVFQTTKGRVIQAGDSLNEPELRAFFASGQTAK